MKKFTLLFAGLLSSILLWLAWPVSPLTLLIFIAWVPLFWVEDRVRSWRQLFGIAYLSMLVWNIATTWWVWNASLPGALGAFFANSLIMCVPWILFHFTKKNLGAWIGYGSLIIYWVTFEYIHHNWELSWPWLTLGNVFATHPEWVQWYEYSGTTGGTLWVLIANVLAYSVVKEFKGSGRTKSYYITFAALILTIVIPVISSFIIRGAEKVEVEASKNIVIVQPNIDPYEEKFTTDAETLIQKLIVLSERQIDKQTSLVVWPETAIPVSVEEDQIKYNRYYQPIWSFLHRHPFVNLVTGINSHKIYGANKENATSTARHVEQDGGFYYDEFNTGAFFDADTTIQLYHKGKLVPGVETLPSFLGFMGGVFDDLGGISGTLGKGTERTVFKPWDNYYKIAPIICYESIYGDYVTGYVRNGANLLAIITNDGWWKNTPGYKQHMNYGRLRAIETRKWIARSANTGISCFIDPMGTVYSPQPWDTEASIKMSVPINDRQTFFVKHGDVFSRAASFVCGALILLNIGMWVRRKMRK